MYSEERLQEFREVAARLVEEIRLLNKVGQWVQLAENAYSPFTIPVRETDQTHPSMLQTEIFSDTHYWECNTYQIVGFREGKEVLSLTSNLGGPTFQWEKNKVRYYRLPTTGEDLYRFVDDPFDAPWRHQKFFTQRIASIYGLPNLRYSS